MQHSARLLLLAGSLVLMTTVASASSNHYGLTISTASTYNVSFNNGVFTATGDHAVLNITDLESALANGNTEVTTDNGVGGDEKGDLHVEAALSWTSTSALTLDAFRSIFVAQSISDEGAGGFTLTYNDGGSGGFFVFQARGHVTFANLSSGLSINGVSYALVDSLPALASAIAANPGGAFALANPYDASQDGTYTSAPITTTFLGTFEGLGNTISNLAISDSGNDDTYTGLFVLVGTTGTIRDFGLVSAIVEVVYPSNASPGTLVGRNEGIIDNAFATGLVSSTQFVDEAGGLVGVNFGGTITNSYASSRVTTPNSYGAMGGLVGWNGGTISSSFATGNVRSGTASWVGGLTGATGRTGVTNSYATGDVFGYTDAYIGGLIGLEENGAAQDSLRSRDHAASDSYSLGKVPIGHHHERVGGSIGENAQAINSNVYWDTTTSGTNIGVGSGHPRHVTGLTTDQFRSGLPAGFDPAIWGENSNINGGFPYLIANPPPN